MMFSRLAVQALRFRVASATLIRSGVRSNAAAASLVAMRNFSSAAPELSTTKVANPEMFCRQCEQTKDNYACK